MAPGDEMRRRALGDEAREGGRQRQVEVQRERVVDDADVEASQVRAQQVE